jgi:hypothetical protein
LSRACLGKMIIVSIKWRQKGIFAPSASSMLRQTSSTTCRPVQKRRAFFL